MDTLYCWSCRGRQVFFWLPGSGRVGVLQPLIVVFTLFSTPLGSVNRVQSMVLALLLTLVASALAQPFPRGPDPPGQPNNIFSYAQYKTDNQFTRSGTPLKVCSTAQLTRENFFADPREFCFLSFHHCQPAVRVGGTYWGNHG